MKKIWGKLNELHDYRIMNFAMDFQKIVGQFIKLRTMSDNETCADSKWWWVKHYYRYVAYAFNT